MDPASVICASVASISLALGAVSAAASVARRMWAAGFPLPVRSIATMVAMASLLAVASRPRPAVASIEPPAVRFADGPTSGPSDDEPFVGAPDGSPTPPDTARERAMVGPTTIHVVAPGDCLWRIARSVLAERTGGQPTRAAIARFWPAIYVANSAVIGDDPNLIFPGQHLEIPEG